MEREQKFQPRSSTRPAASVRHGAIVVCWKKSLAWDWVKSRLSDPEIMIKEPDKPGDVGPVDTPSGLAKAFRDLTSGSESGLNERQGREESLR